MQNRFYFLNFPETKQLFKIFNKNNIEARFVGGCVRDSLLGKPTSDFDIAINISIVDLMKILDTYEIKYIKNGVKYSSIIVILNDKHFDITSLRLDVHCFGRSSEISLTNSFEDDAKRRDFTINAIYVAENGQLFDYFNGLEDLQNNSVVFIGNPQKRIEEDYLRILRYYRFCSKIENKTAKYSKILKKNAYLLSKLSIERIQKELFQIIDSSDTINMMYRDDILQQISSQINIIAYNKLNKFAVSTLLKLVSLFGIDASLKIFKLPKKDKKNISEYKLFMNETLDYCLYKKGIVFAQEIMLLRNVFGNQKKNVFSPIACLKSHNVY